MQPKRDFPDHARLVFSGVLCDVYQWEQELYDGTTTIFEGLSRADTAAVILVDADGRIGINRQEQPGQSEFFAFYGGRIEADEDILPGARRELLEESGYEADDWSLLASFPGFSDHKFESAFFVARNIRRVAQQSLDGGEIITEEWVDFETLADLVIRA
jgi:ADP-ribose pyrophosphatase